MLNKGLGFIKISVNFTRELIAVFNGVQSFKSTSVQNNESVRSQLRRNIHRIEKGLIMRPRREVFAENYIAETVELYILISQRTDLSVEEWKWFTDVLDMFFDVVKHTEIISPIYTKYHTSIRKRNSDDKGTNLPYSVSTRATSSIKFQDLEALFKKRRSIRFFEKKKPDMKAIEDCVTLASQAPSACNRQPFRIIYTGKDKLVSDIANCAGGTSGYADNIPAIMVVVGDLSYFNNPFDRHVIYIDASLYSMQLLLALETKKLSTCVINWPDYKKPDLNLRKLVDLKDSERVVMLIGVGYPAFDSFIPYSHKKTSKDLLKVYK